jgi:hypothetical protein
MPSEALGLLGVLGLVLLTVAAWYVISALMGTVLLRLALVWTGQGTVETQTALRASAMAELCSFVLVIAGLGAGIGEFWGHGGADLARVTYSEMFQMFPARVGAVLSSNFVLLLAALVLIRAVVFGEMVPVASGKMPFGKACLVAMLQMALVAVFFLAMVYLVAFVSVVWARQ